jgi:hypothetical protein
LGDQARHNGLVGNVVDVLEGTVSHDSRLGPAARFLMINAR